MKKLKNKLTTGLFTCFIVLFSTSTVLAQSLDKATVQNAINTQKFVFKAQTMLPMTGTSRYLTGEYEVRLLGDSVISYLPYFGRAYSLTYGESGGIDFTSTKFDYKVNQRKKGGWIITIKPRDARDIQELNFTVSENGYTNLQVTSNNKQPISFTGYIVPKK
jgi:hypothetical protein